MSENLRHFTASLYGFDAVVQRVEPDQWSNESPCEGWCARDVVAHQASVLTAVTKIAESGEMVGPAEFELGDDPVATWNDVRDGVLAALDRPGVPKITEGITPECPLIRFPMPFLETTVWAPTAAMLYQTREVLLHRRATRVAHFEQPRWAWK